MINCIFSTDPSKETCTIQPRFVCYVQPKTFFKTCKGEFSGFESMEAVLAILIV